MADVPGVRKSERPGSAGVYGRDGSASEARACAIVLYVEPRAGSIDTSGK